MDASDDRLSQLREQASSAMASGDVRGACEHLLALQDLTRTRFGEDSRVWLGVVLALGNMSVALGDLSRAAPYIELAASRWESRLERADPARFDLCRLQARVCDARGAYREALPRWAAAVEEARQQPDRRTLSQTITDYANALHLAGAIGEAIAQTEEALRLAREACGDRSVEYVATLSNLAKLLLEAGSPQRAEASAREAYEIVATFDDAHPSLPSVLETLGNIYLGADRAAQAEPLLRRVVALRRSHATGPDAGRLTAISMLHLARALRALGRGPEARDVLEQAASGLTTSPTDRFTASQIYRALASLLSEGGDRSGAVSHFRKAADALNDGGGESHPIRLGLIHDLASALMAAGNQREAEVLLTEAIESCSNVTPPADRIVALWTLGLLYTASMDRARAVATLEQAKELARATQGEQSIAYANSLSHLAQLYQSIDEPRQAEPLIRESLEVLRQVRGDKHPDVIGMLLALADVCDVVGKNDQARGHRHRAIATLRLMPAPRQEACEGDLRAFMEQAHDRDDRESTVELLEALVAVREAAHGRDDVRSEQARKVLERVKGERRADAIPGAKVGNIEILAPDDPRVTDDLRVLQRVVEAFAAGDYDLVVRVARLESGSPSRHVVMALLVSLLRLGRQQEAHNLGAAAIEWTSGDPWTQMLVKLLVGHADGDAVVASAADASQRCQARYYRAIVSERSNPAAARADLEACLSEQAEGCIESVFAQHDLERLDQPSPHPPTAVQRAIDELEREMAAHLKAQRPQEALQVAQEARYRARRRLGPRHPSYADTLMRAAACHEHLGAAEQADRLIAEAIPIFRSRLGDTHPRVKSFVEELTTRCRRAFVERNAATCLIRALPLLPIVEGENLMMVVLPSVQAIQDDAKYGELLDALLAATSRRAAHQALVRVAAGHVGAADALPLLENDWQKCAAWLYCGRYLESRGRNTDAIAAFEACVAVDPQSGEANIARSSLERLRAPADADTVDPSARVQALVNESRVLLKQQQPSRAAAVLEEAIQVHVRRFGEQTGGHASLLVLLAGAKAAEGHLAVAEDVSRRALALTLATEGSNHPTHVSSLARLGAILQSRGKVDEAERTYRQTVERAAVVHGRDSPVYINAVFKLAALLLDAWDRNRSPLELAEAATLNAELVTRLKAISGEQSVEYAAALFNLGLCRKESGTHDEGLSLLQQAAAIYEAGGGQCSVLLARCLGLQSAVLRQLERPSDAEAALLRALAALEGTERDPTERITLLQALADLYHSEQRSAEAIPLLEQAAALASARDAATRETRQAWARLALAYHRDGNFERARPFYERAFGLAGTSLVKPDEISDAGASPA